MWGRFTLTTAERRDSRRNPGCRSGTDSGGLSAALQHWPRLTRISWSRRDTSRGERPPPNGAWWTHGCVIIRGLLLRAMRKRTHRNTQTFRKCILASPKRGVGGIDSMNGPARRQRGIRYDSIARTGVWFFSPASTNRGVRKRIVPRWRSRCHMRAECGCRDTRLIQQREERWPGSFWLRRRTCYEHAWPEKP